MCEIVSICCNRPEEFDKSLTDNISWLDGTGQEELAATASSLLDSVDDTKFANSEVSTGAHFYCAITNIQPVCHFVFPMLSCQPFPALAICHSAIIFISKVYVE